MGAVLHQETEGIGEATVPPCDITKDKLPEKNSEKTEAAQEGRDGPGPV